MGLLDIFLKVRTQRAMGNAVAGVIYNVNGASGVAISDADSARIAAKALSAYFAGKRIISETIGSLPLEVFDGDSNVKLPDDDLYYLVCHFPNDCTDAPTFWQSLVADSYDYGIAFAQINRAGMSNKPLALTRMNPAEWQLTDKGGSRWLVSKPGRAGKAIPESDVFVLLGPATVDPLCPEPIPLAMARVVALGTQVENYILEMFTHGQSAKGTITYPEALSDKRFLEIKARQTAENSGIAGAGKTRILDGGATYSGVDIGPDDQKYKVTRQQITEDVSRFLGVPLHLIQSGVQQSYNSNEANNAAFLTYTLRPIAGRIAKQCERKLIGTSERKYISHDFSALLRADFAARYSGYQSAVGRPWQTVNEARSREGLPPIDGGDTLASPLNMNTTQNKGSSQ